MPTWSKDFTVLNVAVVYRPILLVEEIPVLVVVAMFGLAKTALFTTLRLIMSAMSRKLRGC